MFSDQSCDPRAYERVKHAGILHAEDRERRHGPLEPAQRAALVRQVGFNSVESHVRRLGVATMVAQLITPSCDRPQFWAPLVYNDEGVRELCERVRTIANSGSSAFVGRQDWLECLNFLSTEGLL
jgi:hypothetical protein